MKENSTNSVVRIIERVNPYHAHLYYNGEEVVERNGATPIAWVISEHDSMADAQKALWDLARDYEARKDNLHFEDAETIASLKVALDDEDVDFDWYKGEGVYYCNSNEAMMLKGDSSFDFDVEMFCIK